MAVDRRAHAAPVKRNMPAIGNIGPSASPSSPVPVSAAEHLLVDHLLIILSAQALPRGPRHQWRCQHRGHAGSHVLPSGPDEKENRGNEHDEDREGRRTGCHCLCDRRERGGKPVVVAHQALHRGDPAILPREIENRYHGEPVRLPAIPTIGLRFRNRSYGLPFGRPRHRRNRAGWPPPPAPRQRRCGGGRALPLPFPRQAIGTQHYPDAAVAGGRPQSDIPGEGRERFGNRIAGIQFSIMPQTFVNLRRDRDTPSRCLDAISGGKLHGALQGFPPSGGDVAPLAHGSTRGKQVMRAAIPAAPIAPAATQRFMPQPQWQAPNDFPCG